MSDYRPKPRAISSHPVFYPPVMPPEDEGWYAPEPEDDGSVGQQADRSLGMREVEGSSPSRSSASRAGAAGAPL
jgi:hypothetical protein